MNSKAPAANLQSSHLTAKEIATLTGQSVRSVFMMRELVRTGRQDLVDSVERGDLSALAALKLAKPNKYSRPAKREAPVVNTAEARWNVAVDGFNALLPDEIEKFITALRANGYIGV